MTDIEYCFYGNPECGKCKAVSGCYSTAPERPHANCKCTITAECEPTISWHHEGSSPPDANGVQTVYFSVEVECCDGSTIGQSMALSYVYDNSDEIIAAAEFAGVVMAQNCPGPPGIS